MGIPPSAFKPRYVTARPSSQHLHLHLNLNLNLNVSIPGPGTKPFDADLALHPDGSPTTSASPIGSTPLLLQFGHPYTVVAPLTDTGATPASMVSTVTAAVTLPPGVVR